MAITADDLIMRRTEYRYHHSATRRGYVSRKNGKVVREYKGRFGEGYMIIFPRWDTTQYVTVAYYVK